MNRIRRMTMAQRSGTFAWVRDPCLSVLVVAGILVTGSPALAAKPNALQLKLQVGTGTGDDPMTVVWLETKKGRFVRTLSMLTKDKDWFKSLTTWHKKRKKAQEPASVLDAVTGATMKWKTKRTIQIPLVVAGKSILRDGYVIRFESRRDKGGHYRSLKVPLKKTYRRGKYAHRGYVRRVVVHVVYSKRIAARAARVSAAKKAKGPAKPTGHGS